VAKVFVVLNAPAPNSHWIACYNTSQLEIVAQSVLTVSQLEKYFMMMMENCSHGNPVHVSTVHVLMESPSAIFKAVLPHFVTIM